MKSSDLLATRDYIPTDKNFILATWLRGLKYGNDWYNLIPAQIYFKVYQTALMRVLDSDKVIIKISCLKDDPDVILGYAVLDRNQEILHWAFTKSAWRNIGVMKSLVPTSTKIVTHVTKVGLSLMKKYPEVIFNPFLL